MRHPSNGATIRPAERDRGCIFKDDFRSQANMVASGWTLTGTPTFDARGMILNGTQYGTIPLQRELASTTITMHLDWEPAAAIAASYYILDSAAADRFTINSNATDVRIYMSGIVVHQASHAAWNALLVANQRNVLTFTKEPGAAALAWLNDSVITNALGVTAPTGAAATSLVAGAAYNGTNRTAGIFSRLYIGHHTSTLAEHTAIYNNTMWSWQNRAVVDLQFRTADYDPSTVEGADVITDGNMEAAGTAAYTAFRGAVLSKEGDPHSGTQCLRVTADGAQTIPYASQAALITGEWYYIEGWTRSDGFTQPRVVVGGTVLYLGTTSATWQSYTALFEATATAVLLQSMLATGYADHDDITITHMIPRTLDSSGNGNHATLGDGSTPATYMTQGAGRMEGDGAQYLQIPADATIPSGTYTVLMADKGETTAGSRFLFDARAGGGVGYAYIDGAAEKIIYTSGALFINGAGPYGTGVYAASDVIRTVVFQGITLDITSLLAVFCRNTFVNMQTGTAFDFKLVPGTLNQTQILDYHSNVMRRMGAEL